MSTSVAENGKLSLDVLGSIRRKSMTVSPSSLVKISHLSEGATLPLVVEPAVRGINLSTWATSQREFIEKHLLKHGGILFRNFNIRNASEFEQFINAVSG